MKTTFTRLVSAALLCLSFSFSVPAGVKAFR